jgi:hypothetical protein
MSTLMVMSPNIATPMEGGGSLKSGVKLNCSQTIVTTQILIENVVKFNVTTI